MKSIYLVLLITLPLILCQDYAVPDLDYDTTDPTCDNVNNLIAATNADIARLTNYATVTLPERSSKLNDVYGSAKKTCQIIHQTRPSLIQTSSKLRAENIKTLEKYSHEVKSIASSLGLSHNSNKLSRRLVQLKTNAVQPSELCGDVFDSIIDLKNYLRFLTPSVKNNYINGVLADRLNTLESFQTKCLAAACSGGSGGDTGAGGDSGAGGDDTGAGAGEDNYIFYPTLDSGGNDITNLAGYSVAQLKEYCNSRSDCVGFNTNGWVKNALNPKSDWYQWTQDQSLGFYAKVAPTDDTGAGGDDSGAGGDSGAGAGEDNYIFYPTLDSGGNDITNLAGYSVAQLKEYCNSRSDCVGFNTNGWVKNALNPKSDWYAWTTDQSLGFYAKVSPSDDSNAGQADTNTGSDACLDDWVYYQGQDSGGNDITNLGGYSVDQLKAYCCSNTQCIAFNTNGWVKHTLNPVSQWYQWSTDPNQGFYVKKSSAPATSTPAASSYTFYQGQDSGGNDITNLGGYSVDQLKAYCDSNAQCVGFNTNGWVKNALNPVSQWYNWSSDPNQGFYVKNK